MKHPLSRFFGLGDKQGEQVENKIEEKVETKTIIEKNNREEIIQIPVMNIVPNRYQPRAIFDDDKIEELSQTIKTHGIIQPIVLRQFEPKKYEIIAGERRWRAVKKLGWETIPAIIKSFNDAETASVALIENLQREELTSIEEALAYAKLLELHNLTQEALAQRLGKSQSTIANKLRLLQLPISVQEAIMKKHITERHARALLSLKGKPDLMDKVLNEIQEESLNVKQTELRVENLLKDSENKPTKPKRRAFSKDTRIAINTIRQSLQMVKKTGMIIDSIEEETDDYIQFIIKVPKNKK